MQFYAQLPPEEVLGRAAEYIATEWRHGGNYQRRAGYVRIYKRQSFCLSLLTMYLYDPWNEAVIRADRPRERTFVDVRANHRD